MERVFTDLMLRSLGSAAGEAGLQQQHEAAAGADLARNLAGAIWSAAKARKGRASLLLMLLTALPWS